MSKLESLGITRLMSLHYYVHNLERSRMFYTQKLRFSEVGESGQELTLKGKQKSLVFNAGACTVVCSAPEGTGGRAWRYLQKHPDGIGALVFEVENIERTFKLLEARGGTPIQDIVRVKEGQGVVSYFSITTPFGDTTFRFVQREGCAPYSYPGMVMREAAPGGNSLGFTHIDHITSNFQTMKPALLWMEHVMGFERFWGIEFHTEDVAKGADHGSGLRSAVMWDPHSGVKFANNEPLRPFFKDSQINVFNEQHRGDGVQHAALAVKDLVSAVRVLRGEGVQFMPTPGAYYDQMPERLKRLGIGRIDESLDVLRELEILVDGEANQSYLLQIFLKEAAGLYGEAAAGPFFYELIQRKGDEGFGAGNFRALFESIEREQKGGVKCEAVA
jgi:4-hydroxyphenylpyruvate dioxygenase